MDKNKLRKWKQKWNLNRGSNTFGLAVVKKKRENNGRKSPTLLLARTWNSRPIQSYSANTDKSPNTLQRTPNIKETKTLHTNQSNLANIRFNTLGFYRSEKQINT